MAIDPVLKGTTFAAALEGAERDEQLKRQRREEERKGVQPQARLLAQALRGYVEQVDKAAQLPRTDPAQDAKRASWVRMAQEAQAAPPQSTDLNEVSPMTQTSSEPLVLSTTQINILAAGYESSPFKTGPVGRAVGKLLDEKLIAPTEEKGWWALTEAGKNAYEIHLAQMAAANDQVFKATESEINLDDPALRDDPRESTRRKEIAALLGKNADLNKTIDELDKIVNEQRARIKEIESGAASMSDVDRTEYNMLRKTAFAIEALMKEDEENLTLLEYVQQLRQGFHNETAIVNDINALAASDSKGQMDPRDYVKWLRSRAVAVPSTTLNVYQDIIDAVQNWTADSSQMTLVDYVADLRKKAGQVDDYASRIESLNRCNEDLREQLQARGANAKEHSALMLAEQILDELCALLPEVDEYRHSREQAVKAISALKAKRS